MALGREEFSDTASIITEEAAGGESVEGIRARVAQAFENGVFPRQDKFKKAVTDYGSAIEYALQTDNPIEKQNGLVRAMSQVPELIMSKPDAMDKVLDGLNASFQLTKAVGKGVWDNIKQASKVIATGISTCAGEIVKAAKALPGKANKLRKAVGKSLGKMFGGIGKQLMRIPGMEGLVDRCKAAGASIKAGYIDTKRAAKEGYHGVEASVLGAAGRKLHAAGARAERSGERHEEKAKGIQQRRQKTAAEHRSARGGEGRSI